MLPSLRRGISHEYVRSSLLRSLNAYHQRSLSAEDALDQSKAVLGWIYQANPGRRRALQTVRSYVKDEVPLAYLLGTQPFSNLELKVRPPILIPRPETEEWTMALAETLKKAAERDSPLKILDLCSGSGCIGLALAHHLKSNTSVRLLGVDINPEAVMLARENAQAHQLEVICKYEQGDLFDDAWLHKLLERYKPFDMVVSNPPYIPRAEYEVLETSVKKYEDRKALLGEAPAYARKYKAQDEDGLAFYRRLLDVIYKVVDSSPSKYQDIPLMVLEVGQGQASQVARLVTNKGLYCRIIKDFGGVERSVWVYRTKETG